MEPVLQWGLDFIRAVQTYANPQLTAVMRIISAFGSTFMFFIIIPFIYWCIDEKKGLRLYVMVLFSVWINITLKFMLDQPRPFFPGYDPSVGMLRERMGGLPSGHAQNTLVMLIIISSWIKEKRAKAFSFIPYLGAVLLCLLIGFSRIYLGVHFPTDVAAGWFIGSIILCGYFLLSGRIEALLAAGGTRAGMITSAVVSFIMILYLPSEEALMSGGTLLGIGIGYCLNRRNVGFKSALLFKRTGITKYLSLFARFILGIAGFILILFAASKIIPQGSANFKLYSFISLALGGLWVSVAAPWIFIKLHLASAGHLASASQLAEAQSNTETEQKLNED